MQDANHKRKQSCCTGISRIALIWSLLYECSVSRMQLNCEDRNGDMKLSVAASCCDDAFPSTTACD